MKARKSYCTHPHKKSILPVSTYMNGEYGVSDVVLSMPCVVGKDGIETIVPINLSEEERSELVRSAEVLKEIIKGID